MTPFYLTLRWVYHHICGDHLVPCPFTRYLLSTTETLLLELWWLQSNAMNWSYHCWTPKPLHTISLSLTTLTSHHVQSAFCTNPLFCSSYSVLIAPCLHLQGVQEIHHIVESGLHRNPIDPYIIRKLWHEILMICLICLWIEYFLIHERSKFGWIWRELGVWHHKNINFIN